MWSKRENPSITCKNPDLCLSSDFESFKAVKMNQFGIVSRTAMNRAENASIVLFLSRTLVSCIVSILESFADRIHAPVANLNK